MADEEKGQKPPKKGKGDKAEEAAEAKPKRKLPLKLIIIAVVAAALLGGGGWFAWSHFSGAGGGHEGGAAESAEGEEGGGQTLRLEQFIVNLIDPLGRRYLKVQIELEMDSLEGMEEAGKKSAQIRDSIITLLTSKSYADIESPEGKLQLRQEIISRVNQFLHKGKAVNAYFTDFVIQ